MILFELILFIFVVYYIFRRLDRAVASGDLIGFLLNPMLYFLVFAVLYLLVANILVYFGAYQILITGLPSNVDELTGSNFYVLIFFIGILFCYMLTADLKGLKFKPLKYNKFNESCFLFLSFFIFLFLFYLCVKHGGTLLALRADRAIVYDYFANQIYMPYKIGVVVNVYSALLIILLFSRRKISRIVVLLPFLCFVALDFMQGGRSIIIRLFIIIYLCFAILNNKTYFKPAILSIAALGILPVLSRFAEGDGIYSFFIAFGEFIYTRVTVDYVIYHGFNGDGIYLVLKYILSLLPGIIGSSLIGDEMNYREMIANISGLSFGLAGNIVAESIFYCGNFFIITAFFVLITAKLFYLKLTICRLPFVIGLIIFISNVQNIYRTSFFEFGLVIFYLTISYLSIFTMLLWNKKIYHRGHV
ncbi:hypothetical protein [Shewanella decolorationis]|uniref:O-antigen polymerase n=1 Tax=Shewanella decolorationis S12 TaxID=1353536 RepID=A0ABP2Z3Q7_9GAMM|nr:hypothetical protein [Shewanella decolorationis]ESE41255.1 o-antigen polymerase [Shewanella decolorationis S12]GLR31674.1 hypothetical protein GCM10007922_12310 [Shewanella decolorationis]